MKVRFKDTGTLGGRKGYLETLNAWFYRNVYSCLPLAFSLLVAVVVFCLCKKMMHPKSLCV